MGDSRLVLCDHLCTKYIGSRRRKARIETLPESGPGSRMDSVILTSSLILALENEAF